MHAVFAKVLALCLYLTTAEGLINTGTPDTSTLLHLQTLTEEMFRLQRDIADIKQSNADLKQSNADLKQSNSNILKEMAIMKSRDESVAFFAYLTKNVVDPLAGQTIVFAQTEVNVGNAYDRAHGIFVAPIDGTYYFTFTTSVPPSVAGNSLHLYMMQNGQKRMYVFLDENTKNWLQRGSSRVVQLKRGDRIWMEVGSIIKNNTILGYNQRSGSHHTHFSGFLIHAD